MAPKRPTYNTNYDFKDQHQPKKNMGQGEFANMPTEPRYMAFTDKHETRSGIINSFTTDLIDVTDIAENHR